MFDLRSLLDVGLAILIVLLIAPFLGRYMAKVYMGRPSLLDALLDPLETAIYRFLGTHPRVAMGWKEYAASLLVLNAVATAFVYVLLVTQGSLPMNPLGAPNMSWDLAFHTSVSFMTNTDFQHYTPEHQLSMFSALLGLMMLMFLSAATGLTVAAAFIRGFVRRDGTVGNFWVDITRTLTRILLPLSLLGAFLFALAGVPQTFTGSITYFPLSGGMHILPLGPVATWDAIEFLGTNGGGYFAANAAHPLQNPSAVTNFLAVIMMLVIPFSTIFTFGHMVRRPGESWPLLVTVLTIFLVALGLFMYFELSNPFLAGVATQNSGYLYGAETRFTIPEDALFQVSSIYANVGATSMVLGALTPVAQSTLLFGMFLQSSPGGDGTGFGMLLIFTLLTVFIGGLMVGRTPEYLGKKIGQPQIKWATVTILSHPFAIFVPLVVALVSGLGGVAAGTGPHAFTVLLYEFTSESANNGSGMGPIQDNTLFFNVAGAVVMLVGRYLPILAMLAIGGSLASQDTLPPGPGTLRTQSATFALLLLGVLLILTGLLFLPVLALGPLSQIGVGGL